MIEIQKSLEALEKLCKDNHLDSLKNNKRGGAGGQACFTCSCGLVAEFTSTLECDALTILKQEIEGTNPKHFSYKIKRHLNINYE